MADLVIDGSGLQIAQLEEVAREARKVRLAPAVFARIDAARAVVERYASGDQPVYGLNTGLGGNLGHRLPSEAIAEFQAQLIRGRAVAVGPPFSAEVVRAAMLVRLNGMAQGASGVSQGVVTMLAEMLNRGVTPLVPAYGSIGAADLAPMAHLGLVMLGSGEALHGGRTLPGAEALRMAGLEPLRLEAKDGLGLINSNALTAGQAALVLAGADRLLFGAIGIAALACEGYAANLAAFDPRTAALRPAPGQVRAAALARALLAGSSLERQENPRSIQDALSFRCLPQIAGVALDALGHAVSVTETEINAAGDSPAVLAEDGLILSTGNFHLGALALAFDALALAFAQLATASFARIIKLMSPAHSGLPRYLSPVGGASAGLVPMQKPAAALLAEIRLKANPAGIDAVAVSDFVEDHAPLAPLAVRKLEEQLSLSTRLIAIEALVAAPANDLRDPASLGAGSRLVYAFVRESARSLEADRETGPEAEALAQRLLAGELATRLGGFRTPLPDRP